MQSSFVLRQSRCFGGSCPVQTKLSSGLRGELGGRLFGVMIRRMIVFNSVLMGLLAVTLFIYPPLRAIIDLQDPALGRPGIPKAAWRLCRNLTPHLRRLGSTARRSGPRRDPRFERYFRHRMASVRLGVLPLGSRESPGGVGGGRPLARDGAQGLVPRGHRGGVRVGHRSEACRLGEAALGRRLLAPGECVLPDARDGRAHQAGRNCSRMARTWTCCATR